MSAVIARHDNVVDVDFRPAAPPPAAGRSKDLGWSRAVEVGPAADRPASWETPATTRATVPARWSPRPVRVLRRRITRSQLAADFRGWGFQLAVLIACWVLVAWLDLTFFDLAHLMNGELP